MYDLRLWRRIAVLDVYCTGPAQLIKTRRLRSTVDYLSGDDKSVRRVPIWVDITKKGYATPHKKQRCG